MNRPNEQYFLPYLSLRQAIGWIGVAMPLVVRLGGWAFEGIPSNDSISAYYYTGMRDVFVASLVLIGALLACYRSPAKLDTWLAVTAGLAAIGIALFPTSPRFAQEILDKYPATGIANCYMSHGIIGYHFLFVGTFFALGFYLVYFRFRAFTPPIPTPQKIRRNQVYQVCGGIMLLSFIVIGILAQLHKSSSIFWPESAAVVSFAVAWIVKGQFVLRDKVA